MLRKIFIEPKKLNPNFKVKDWMEIPTLLLRLNGMCHVNFSQWLPLSLNFLSPLINFIIFFFITFGFIHVIVLFSYQIYFHESDKVDDVITNAISQIIIYSFALFVLLYFQLKRKTYLNLCEYMNENFRQRSAHGLTFISGERMYFNVVRLDYIWTFMCVYGTLQWVFAPILKSGVKFPIMIEYPFLDQYVSEVATC